MIELYYPACEDIDYPDDVERFVKLLNERGYNVSAVCVQDAWKEYSDDMCASWLLPNYSDDVVVSTLLRFLKERTSNEY